MKRRIWALVAVIAFALVLRVTASFAFVAAAVTQSLSSLSGPAEIRRYAEDAARGFQALAGIMNPQADRRRTISVFDVPAEVEAMAKAPKSQRTAGGALVIRIED